MGMEISREYSKRVGKFGALGVWNKDVCTECLRLGCEKECVAIQGLGRDCLWSLPGLNGRRGEKTYGWKTIVYIQFA